VYHITSRGNAPQEIFLDDKDSSSFLDILAQVIDRLGAPSHTFILDVCPPVIGKYTLGIIPPDAPGWHT